MNQTALHDAPSTSLPCIKGRWNFALDEEPWNQFASTWCGMPADVYMADGGTYRYRRFSEFKVDVSQGLIERLPHLPYKQSLQDNYLNGGIDRHYEPMTDLLDSNAVLREVLLRTGALVSDAAGTPAFLVQVFQNRIVATASAQGRPTPEGMHRDGVDFVLSLLIDRVGVVGGTSEVRVADGGRSDQMLMSEPGDFLLLDDQAMRHSVTPLTPARADQGGHRDVLIAMYTSWYSGLR